MMISINQNVMTALGRLTENGFEAFLVGGCVRDFLRGITPHDFDITTNAVPSQTAECFSDCTVIKTGMQHGTVTVVIGGENIEITTYRTDGAYSDGRRPDNVIFTKTLTEDLARRDFTMNAVAYSPEKGIVDPFSGQKDIAEKRIVCVGDPDTRFREDGLRIMRAVRFAAVTGFEIEEKTSESIHRNRMLLKNISSERLFSELKLLICGDFVRRVLEEYHDVLEVFIPEITPCIGFDQRNYHHCYDVFEHTLRVVENTPPETTVRLAALFHDIAKPSMFTTDKNGVGHFQGHPDAGAETVNTILHRLKCDNAAREDIVRLVKYHDYVIQPNEKAVRRAVSKTGFSLFRRLVSLKRADRLSTAPEYRGGAKEVEELGRIADRIERSKDCCSLKELAVNGNDLIAAGITDGKEIGFTLRMLLNSVINEEVPNEKQALLKLIK